jgi:hypothetical protein
LLATLEKNRVTRFLHYQQFQGGGQERFSEFLRLAGAAAARQERQKKRFLTLSVMLANELFSVL